MKKERNSMMELLRIISMFIIVMHHYVVHGVADYLNIQSENILNGVLLQWMSLGGKLGCLIFICITGYYQINGKINIKRIILLLLQVQFYSIILYILNLCFLKGVFNIKDVIRSVFPTIFNQYWFFTAYLVMYILTPVLNRIIKLSNENEMRFYIIFLALMWFVIPSFGGSTMYGDTLPILLLMYTCGAYIRLYLQEKRVIFFAKKILFTSIALLLLSVLIFLLLGNINHIFSEHSTHFANMNSIVLFFIATSSVIVVSNMKPFNSKLINKIAGSSFGVYLIHDNRFVGKYLWTRVFINNKVLTKPFFIFIALSSCIIVYLICTVIDILRKNMIERKIEKLLDPCFQYINKFIIK